MKYLLWLVFIFGQEAGAQKLKKADKATLSNLQAHIAYLADDKLEGRRTGSDGEKLAYEYISREFEKAGFQPKGTGQQWLQQFEINDGKAVLPVSHFILNDHDLKLNDEYFPFVFSPNISLEATASMALRESGSPWFLDIKDLIESHKDNPHYDLEEAVRTAATSSANKGATCLIVFNSSETADHLEFEPKGKASQVKIPVLYVTKKARESYMKDETEPLDIKLKVEIAAKTRNGHNVIGFINNNAANTIILGAHYDHLGYGEDHNSLFTGASPTVHNGADDNASGTATVLELGKLLKASKFKKNNYLLIAFSGEELGLFGSKYFLEHPTVELGTINFMVNLDMVGRLKDSTRGLNIGGYGTSPVWGELLNANDKYFRINFDSSGTGPSDHTSFYRKNIPVLFFFTGAHSDYHKPSDDADKVNYNGALQVVKYIYNLIEKTDKRGKLPFTKTREVSANTATSFKVTLGIMPDYSYTGTGVKVDGVSEGKVAQKAGIIAGDVITSMNDIAITDLQAYMKALNTFNKGEAASVRLKRGDKEMTVNVVFQ